MGGLQNKICDVLSDIKQKKLDILNKIKKLKARCDGFPQLIIDTSLPSLNINFAVLDFLRDILGLLGRLNINELQALIVDWLVSALGPLLKRISEILKSAIKDCYTCKINPEIPGWLFTTGYNVELEQIDRTCLFKTSPTSVVGKLLYHGTSTSDMNVFLYDVIQNTGPQLWSNPHTAKPIATFEFLESDPSAFISVPNPDNCGAAQSIDPRNNVFNMKIHSDYEFLSLTTFVNDYVDSQKPLFDVNKVIPNTIDLLFGSITGKFKLSDECLDKTIELEKGLEKLINSGVDDPEILVDNTFFEFTTPEIVNIKDEARNRKSGERPFTECCNKRTASVSMETLTDLNDELSASGLTESKKVGVIDKSMKSMADQTTNNVNAEDADKAKGEFLFGFIQNISIVMSKLTLSPKINFLLFTMGFLVNCKSRFSTTKEFLRLNICIIRQLLGELLKKLIFEFLLPLILKYLKPLIICLIRSRLKERKEAYTISLESLNPLNAALPDEAKSKFKTALGNAKKGLQKVNNKAQELGSKFKPNKGKFC